MQPYLLSNIIFIVIAAILFWYVFQPLKWFKRKPTDQPDPYTGYKEITLDEDEIITLYANLDQNKYGCLVNEYLLVRHADGGNPDVLKWTGENFIQVKSSIAKSTAFGAVKAKDAYQSMAIDSFSSNKITQIKGSAGTGKTYLSFAYYLGLLEKGKIDKIIVFCNPMDTKDSQALGFMPGSKDAKLFDSAAGYMLKSKLGGSEGITTLIDQNKLELLPLCQLRGYDTTGMRAGIYIAEAQNLSINLMKLALQRIGDDCICIIDGDCNAQVDSKQFEGIRNGMRRVSKVFRGEQIYGEITLQNIWRSQIAKIAEKL
jgi:predicted ribonuclease YlaK